jgi:hypothetical protein
MSSNIHRKCCNPFNNHRTQVTKGLRDVTEESILLHHSLKKGDKVCTSCRKKLTELNKEAKQSPSKSGVNSSGELTSETDDCEPTTSSAQGTLQ